MKNLFALLLALYSGVVCSGNQKANVELLINDQIAAFNSHDIVEFASYFHPQIEQLNYPGKVDTKGREELITQFTKFFSEHKPRAKILNRIVHGDKVIDFEEMTYIEDGRVLSVQGVVIYTVVNGLIRRMEIIR